MKEYQPYYQQLADLAFTIGTTQTAQVVQLKELEKKLYQESEIANLIGFVLEVTLTPTFTTAPTLIGHNNALASIQLYDGADMLFDGQGNDLRMFETLENGKTVQGEAITQTSTNPRFWSRFLPVGPMNLAGSPSDYMVPCAELAEGGYLRITPSVLTDISADTTAASMTVRVLACLAPSGNELRVGPKYQRLVRANSGSGFQIGDEALYAYVGATNASYAAFAANAFGKVTIRTTKRGRYVNNVDAELLARAFNAGWRPGSMDQVMGETRDATFDVAPRIVNFSSATALGPATPALQPFIWAPKDARLSKLKARVDPNDAMTIEFSGAQGASGNHVFGRFLPHTGDSIQRRVRKAAGVLGLSTGQPQPKTLSKRAAKPTAQSVKYGVFYAKAA
jgi:hypothetical protein